MPNVFFGNKKEKLRDCPTCEYQAYSYNGDPCSTCWQDSTRPSWKPATRFKS